MSRTHSKERNLRKSATHQKTEKRKPKHVDCMEVTKVIPGGREHRLCALVEEQAQSRLSLGCGFTSAYQQKYLKIANPPNIRINRARIIDWLLDVCRAFELRWESYWCAVELLDYLITTLNAVQVSNIHISAVTCLLISAKIHETNPLSLEKLVEKAVYNVFTTQDVIEMEAEIVLRSANSHTKPRHLDTIYNYLHELYPKMHPLDRIETLRRLVLVWMDPVQALETKDRSAQGTQMYISYADVVRGVVLGLAEGRHMTGLQRVRAYFHNKYECDNIEPCWAGYQKIRL